jgi:Nickel responsive protein SCO4226-like
MMSSSANPVCLTADSGASFPRAYARGSISTTGRTHKWGLAAKSVGISPFRPCWERRSLEQVITFLIEAYVADADIAALRDRLRAAAAAMGDEGHAIRYLRSVLVRADETCFHLFDAASEEVVAELARRAEVPYERIVEAEERTERIS